MSGFRLHHSPAGGAPLPAFLVLAALVVLTPPRAGAQTAKSAAKSDAASPGNVEKGKQEFTSHGCNACHGSDGQGSPQPLSGGPPIGPPPISSRAFARYVRATYRADAAIQP